jgi:hypothetical protein
MILGLRFVAVASEKETKNSALRQIVEVSLASRFIVKITRTYVRSHDKVNFLIRKFNSISIHSCVGKNSLLILAADRFPNGFTFIQDIVIREFDSTVTQRQDWQGTWVWTIDEEAF